MLEYDVAVIGAGAAGLVACKLANGLGKKTVLIEIRKIGGDCTWFGCIPSKALIKAANIARDVGRITGFGLESSEPIDLNCRNVMEHVRAVVQADADGHPASTFEEEGIDVIFGAPRFINKHHIKINGKRIRSKKFIICTGGHPFIPNIEGIDEVPYLTNETIFDLEKLPESMIILGGGPIGSEMSSALARLGVKVTVVEKSTHILVREEAEMSAALMECMREQGVNFVMKNKIIKLRQEEGLIVAKLLAADGHKSEIRAESLLISVGRRPNIDGLKLKNAGVEFDSKGIKVNKHLRTTTHNIYAAGDVVPPYLFTHVAEYEAVIATTNACMPVPVRKTRYQHVPWCTFTEPQLARVGMTEEQAKERYGNKVRVYRRQNKDIDRAKTDLATDGFSKIVCDTGGRILGVHILGECAAEIMHEAQLARSVGLGFGKIASVIHAYPSYSDSIRQPAKECYIDVLKNNFFIKPLLAMTARRNRKRMILLSVVAVLFVLLWFSGIRQALSLENIQARGQELKTLSNDHYAISVLGYIGLYILVAAFTLPVAAGLTIAGGFLYSFIIATVYVNIGATAGATAAFLFARYIAGGPLQEKYKDKFAKFNAELEENGARYLFTIRLIFVFPFFLVNLLAGLTKVKVRTFVWTTSLGILPSSLIYAYAGEQLGTINKVSEIFSGRIMVAFILLAGFALMPTVIKKIKHFRQHRRKAKNKSGTRT